VKHSYLVQPEGLGPPLGLYSQVCVAAPGGTTVVVAGQTGVDAHGKVAPDIQSQTEQAFANLGTALRATGATYADVVKTTTFLVGRLLLDEFMATRRAVFASLYPEGNFPPNTLLLVEGLVEERLLVEVEALAIVAGPERDS
jgi:enamine deaminase RidA (YjgF/YER057c/UK114 family)